MAFKVRFQVSIAVTVLAIIVALTGTIVGSLYVVSSRVAKETAGQLFGAVAHGLYERIDNQMGWTVALAAMGASQQGLDAVRGDGPAAPILARPKCRAQKCRAHMSSTPWGGPTSRHPNASPGASFRDGPAVGV